MCLDEHVQATDKASEAEQRADGGEHQTHCRNTGQRRIVSQHAVNDTKEEDDAGEKCCHTPTEHPKQEASHVCYQCRCRMSHDMPLCPYATCSVMALLLVGIHLLPPAVLMLQVFVTIPVVLLQVLVAAVVVCPVTLPSKAAWWPCPTEDELRQS